MGGLPKKAESMVLNYKSPGHGYKRCASLDLTWWKHVHLLDLCTAIETITDETITDDGILESG